MPVSGLGPTLALGKASHLRMRWSHPCAKRPSAAGATGYPEFDLVPDLGEDIGSIRWFRGLGTLTILSVFALALLPDFGPVYGAQPPMPTEAEFEEARAQMIMPIAYGSDSGRRMAATDAVVALGRKPRTPTHRNDRHVGSRRQLCPRTATCRRRRRAKPRNVRRWCQASPRWAISSRARRLKSYLGQRTSKNAAAAA